ncbi:MAG: DMT family transporter [Cetobacterium sp.]|uniref:DMT family transporter n=1 Tax=Cetobacterium sp. TaxID=2071632 RepID=UPI003F349619
MHDKIRGPLYMTLSALSFATMGSFTKALSVYEFSTFQILFFRGIISGIVVYFMAKKGEITLGGRTSQGKKLLFLRSLFGVIGAALYFFAISKINLANAVLLNNLSPFWVIILAWIFLKEKPSKKGLMYLIIILIGALLVIKPKIDFEVFYSCLGFLSSLFAGAAYTYVRHLRTMDNPRNIVFWFSIYSSLFVFIPMILMNYKSPNMYQMLLLVAVGVCSSLGQVFLTLSYKVAESSEVSIYQYLNIVFATIYGIFIWNQVPDMYSILGAVLIIGSGILNLMTNKK